MAYQPKMTLTERERGILEGKEGEVKAKMMETLVRFGDLFGATRMVPITHKTGHLVTSFGIPLLTPLYPMMDKIINSGEKAEGGFTMDPRPFDYKNVKCSFLEKIVFSKIMYGEQARYEKQLAKVGLIDKSAFSCTAYLPEVGNTPEMGDILSWSESSAVVFANSVLGARCNRNSANLDLFGSILGMVPEFGLLTDEGRKATWRIIVKTSKKPEAQILGSAIGMKVMDEVPYIEGLDAYIEDLPDEDTVGYLKDMGAAAASNGAVGLFHVENITPEAKANKGRLLASGFKTYVIDDEELERVYASYPIMWKKPKKKPDMAFIGCPHLTAKQLEDWTHNIKKGLEESGLEKVTINVILTAAPAVVEEFKKGPSYEIFLKTGAHLSSICPLMYTNNPLTKSHRIITNSNKLRTYSTARYMKDEEVLAIICGKEKR